MQKKKLIAQIFLCAGKAVHDFTDRRLFEKGDGVELALYYEKTGADALLVFELSKTLSEREKSLAVLRAIHNSVDIPIIAGGGIDQLKDVEQFLLLGCNRVLLNMNKESNRNMLEQVSEKFGKERIAVCVSEFSALSGEIERLKQCVEEVFLFGDHFHLYDTVKRLPMKCIPIVSVLNLDHMGALLRIENVVGISGKATSATGVKIYELRKIFARQGLFLQSCESAFTWADLKKNSDGLVPVIVQDYKNDQVLMMAYMSEESLEMTLLTGWMTYFSRSRQQLWLKGETSGHFQRVKEILIDCDNDTLLARVIQTGAACHTGNRTCFYREMVSAPAGNKEKIAPLETVLADISERISCADEESNPKKMSDQEMDQVLYKLGKSTIGLLLSAKSHDEKTVRKQSCDCLFELMVLMKQLGITWEELSGEFQTYDFQIEV